METEKIGNLNEIRYVCYKSTYNKIYGRVYQNKKDNYRDVVWQKSVVPTKCRIKKENYSLYDWL